MSVGGATRSRGRPRFPSRRIPRWVVVLAAAAATVAGLAAFGESFLNVYRLDREAARLEERKRDLQHQNAILREEIKLLQTPGYIERIAREQLGLVKPGEVAVLIVQPPATPPAVVRNPASRPSWLEQAWRAIVYFLRR